MEFCRPTTGENGEMTKLKPPTLEEFEAITSLASELAAAKVVEGAARANRIAIEAKLAMLIPCEEEGQRTIRLANKRGIVVERGLIYKAEVGEILALDLFREINIAPPIESKTTRSLHVIAYKWYKENQPEAFKQIAKFVEVKPKKTAVTIKPAPTPKKKAK